MHHEFPGHLPVQYEVPLHVLHLPSEPRCQRQTDVADGRCGWPIAKPLPMPEAGLEETGDLVNGDLLDPVVPVSPIRWDLNIVVRRHVLPDHTRGDESSITTPLSGSATDQIQEKSLHTMRKRE